jgi:hypothetical protein
LKDKGKIKEQMKLKGKIIAKAAKIKATRMHKG